MNESNCILKLNLNRFSPGFASFRLVLLYGADFLFLLCVAGSASSNTKQSSSIYPIAVCKRAQGRGAIKSSKQKKIVFLQPSLSIAVYCLSIAVYCLSIAVYCLSIAVYCLSIAVYCLPGPRKSYSSDII